MIPRFTPSMDWRDIWSGAGGALRSEEAVAAFEAAFAERAGQREAVAFPYGRTGINFLLRALGLKDKDIICPAYTCVVVPNAIVYSGNRNVFVDSSPTDANMCLDAAEAATTKDTGAIIATSIYGHPVDLDRLDALRTRHPDLPIIQDCAHSFFADWKDRPVHREGCAAIFALNVSKLSCSVFGGMITSDDRILAQRLRDLRDVELSPATTWKAISRFLYAVAAVAAFSPLFYGMTLRMQRARILDRFTRYYEDGLIDMPADWLGAMTGLEARIGISSLTHLDDRISARQQYEKHYRDSLEDHPAIRFFPLPPSATASFSHCAALVAEPKEVREACYRLGVELGELIEYVVPRMKAYCDSPGAAGDFPVSRSISAHVINLPVASQYSQSRAERVVGILRQVLDKQSPAPNPRGAV